MQPAEGECIQQRSASGVCAWAKYRGVPELAERGSREGTSSALELRGVLGACQTYTREAVLTTVGTAYPR
jgi:hypothetical protein